MSNNTRQEEHALRQAREARLGLAADLRDIQQVGGRIIREGEQRLKRSALVVGAIVIGGIGIGLALSAIGRRHRRAGDGPSREQSQSVLTGLIRRAAIAVGVRLAKNLIASVAESRRHDSNIELSN